MNQTGAAFNLTQNSFIGTNPVVASMYQTGAFGGTASDAMFDNDSIAFQEELKDTVQGGDAYMQQTKSSNVKLNLNMMKKSATKSAY